MQVRKLFTAPGFTEYSQKKWCPPVQLTHGEQWKSTQSGRFPQSCGAESEATRFCRCVGDASSSSGSLRNNDPSQRSNHNNRVGRCRWWCASNGKPCNIVGCVVDSRLVKSGESPPLTHAWFLAWGCALPVNTLWGGFFELWQILTGRVHADSSCSNSRGGGSILIFYKCSIQKKTN